MYFQTLEGSNETDLGFAWLANFLRMPKVALPAAIAAPALRLPPPSVIASPVTQAAKILNPKINIPKIQAPKVNISKIQAPKFDTKKISQQLTKPTQQLAKGLSQGVKSISKNLESVFQNMAPGSPEEFQQPEDTENFNYNYDSELIPTEEPVELTEQESEEMLGAITQGQAGMLNTGISIASSFFPGASVAMPFVSQAISAQVKKPKPKPSQQIANLLKPKPATKPVAKPATKPATKPQIAKREIEKKSDNTLLIIGGIAAIALIAMNKKK